jgi:hypothetical protein
MPKRQRKNPAAVALGRLGGQARGKTVMQTIPAAKRSEYARHAVNARWAKYRAQKKEKKEA